MAQRHAEGTYTTDCDRPLQGKAYLKVFTGWMGSRVRASGERLVKLATTRGWSFSTNRAQGLIGRPALDDGDWLARRIFRFWEEKQFCHRFFTTHSTSNGLLPNVHTSSPKSTEDSSQSSLPPLHITTGRRWHPQPPHHRNGLSIRRGWNPSDTEVTCCMS